MQHAFVHVLTFWARDNRTALVLTLLDHAVLANWLRKRAHAQVAHQHLVVARAVQTRLIGQNAIALAVVIVVVVAAQRCGGICLFHFGAAK